ncbi:enoyl-CoA hydratase/isomerase family protein [Amycolatopsis sp. NPDC051371]|uniref:enoyl-CoA hydratase/isomerase family protein n=1 Tax=Amycolatopsis sp. NPDC051371 TaxID=3155800 RepID=UPI003419C14C
MTDEVVVESAGEIGTVRLNRPDRGNSVTPDVVTSMGDGVRELAETDAVRAIVLTGTGKVFCAGADVQEMYAVFVADGADGLMTYLADVWMPAVQRTVRALWSVPKPLVAAFNGAATAGGLDFGLSCDGRVAASTARFAESYVNLGMVPVAGGIFLLPRLVGPAAATELIASGELIGAERAQALGLVNEVCEPDQLTARSAELASRLAKGPGATFTRLKLAMRRAETEELEQVLRESYQANVDLLTRDDVRSRVVAVMERYSRSKAESR